MDEPTLAGLATQALDRGDWDEACRLGRQIAAGAEPDTSPSLGWIAEGIGLREQGKAEEAIALLARGLQVFPDEVFLLTQLARTHLRVGNHQLAYELARRASARAPEEEEPGKVQGMALLSLERPSEALAIFEAQGGFAGDEELRNLTAWAIIGVAESRCERISPDRRGPTSPESAAEVVALAERVLSVKGIAEDARLAATEFRTVATDAVGKRYVGGAAHVVSHLGLGFLAFIVVLLASKEMVLAILAAIAVIAVLTFRSVQPLWRVYRDAAEAFKRAGVPDK